MPSNLQVPFAATPLAARGTAKALILAFRKVIAALRLIKATKITQAVKVRAHSAAPSRAHLICPSFALRAGKARKVAQGTHADFIGTSRLAIVFAGVALHLAYSRPSYNTLSGPKRVENST